MAPYVNGAVPKITFKVSLDNANFTKEKRRKVGKTSFSIIKLDYWMGVML